MTARKVLNVGGNSREITLPVEYDGWEHILLDIDAGNNPDVLCDARELDRLSAAAYDAVYCSHNLEHYYRHELNRVLAGFLHVLREDGFACIRVPDISALMRVVVERNLDIEDVLYQSQAGPIAVRDVIYGYDLQIQRSGSDYFAHKTGFSQKSLISILKNTGFPIVFSRCDNLEIVVYAFRREPTAYAADLLKLPTFSEDAVSVANQPVSDERMHVSVADAGANQPSSVGSHRWSGPARRLHVGGTKRCDGWEVLNVSAAPYVDHVGKANELIRFADGTFLEIYASHVVEHLDYKFELTEALKEWYRVLEPGGRVMISVPDLDTLANMITSKNEFTVNDRFFVMQMLFGGHVDQHDYHVVGLNQEFLGYFLNDAGYVRIRRVDDFNLFDDTSSMIFKGVAISLNMVAEKPVPAGQDASLASTKPGTCADEDLGRGIEKSPRTDVPDAIMVRTADDILLSVPRDLDCLTTQVLLEREHWHEREVGFVAGWLKPGMHVVDVGAGLGVYCLPMANAVGKTGGVAAFEPVKENLRHLAVSRAANRVENIALFQCMLADEEQSEGLSDIKSAEADSVTGEMKNSNLLAVTELASTLDSQLQARQWHTIDFVRISTADQSGRIVAGGRVLFSSQSPLVMYRMLHGRQSDESVRWIFEALGYRTYRLLGDASCLVPVGSQENLDAFTSNLFAAKPDRSASLFSEGLLVEQPVTHELSVTERSRALKMTLARPYARAFELSVEDVRGCPFGEAFVAYAASRGGMLSPARRWAALNAAFDILSRHCSEAVSPAGLATLTRVALDLGQRRVAVDALQKLVRANGIELDQPFFPPCARYEELLPQGRESEWFVAAANEQFELTRSHSSRFQSGELERLKWLCDSHFSSAEIHRRLILEAVRRGLVLPELLGYLGAAQSHRNPQFWSEAGLPELLRLR